MINAPKRKEKSIWGNVFYEKKKKPGFKFNPGIRSAFPGAGFGFAQILWKEDT